jgi:hypothetical protein
MVKPEFRINPSLPDPFSYPAFELNFIGIEPQGCIRTEQHKCDSPGNNHNRREGVVQIIIKSQSCEATVKDGEVDDVN